MDYLLFIIGRVGQHCRHVEHDLIVFKSCVQRVCSGRVGCKKKLTSNTMSDLVILLHLYVTTCLSFVERFLDA